MDAPETCGLGSLPRLHRGVGSQWLETPFWVGLEFEDWGLGLLGVDGVFF